LARAKIKIIENYLTKRYSSLFDLIFEYCRALEGRGMIVEFGCFWIFLVGVLGGVWWWCGGCGGEGNGPSRENLSQRRRFL